MYNEMRNDFAERLLSLQLSKDVTRAVLDLLDVTAYQYDVRKKETEVAVYETQLPELAKNYLVARAVEGLAKGTLYNYKKTLEKFFQIIQKKPCDVCADDIVYFLYWYKKRNEDRTVSNRSLNKVLDSLKAFFRWCTERRYIEYNPASVIKHIKCEEKIQAHLTEVEMEKVRRACDTLREKALVEFMYSTGCRVAEVANMKLSDINWDNRTVLIFGKGRKYRTGFLNVRSCFALQEYIEHERKGESEYLFPSIRKPYNQISADGIEKIVSLIAKRSGIDKNLTPHVFRRTVATHMLEKGAAIQDIQKILGHEKIETTLKYAKVNMKQVQDTHRRYVS